MKKLVGNLIYDTNTATELFSSPVNVDKLKRDLAKTLDQDTLTTRCIPNSIKVHTLFQTPNERYFATTGAWCYYREPKQWEFEYVELRPLSARQAMEMIAANDRWDLLFDLFPTQVDYA